MKHKDLGFFDLFCIASGAMISSGLFVLPGIVYAKIGPVSFVAYLIASLLVIPAMLSQAELSTAMPKSGGTYFFIDRSMGPGFGTLAGLSSWFALSFKSAFALLGIGAFAVLVFPDLGAWQIKAIAAVFCILFGVLNLFST
ncbi:MAG: amino acid permease, partial [Victivallales bacterium]|nr:amino acid permease [Victivallales bacterium]